MDPMVWSAGSVPKRRKVVHAVRDMAFLPGPAGIWDGRWVVVAATPITCRDVEVWPYSVDMHWPQGEANLGGGGVSFVEVLILYALWVGVRLDLEKAVPRYRRAGRSISVSAVPFGPGIDIWRSCRCIGVLFRALDALPGCIRWFLPCDVGANHCRLRHIGWERSSHGLTSRPRESASEVFLDELLVLFGYPSRSAAALLSGVLHLRYCSGRFACEVPTWSLRAHGHVRDLISEFADGVVEPWSRHVGHAQLLGLVGPRVLCGSRFLGDVKRVRLNRKKLQHTLLATAGREVFRGLRVLEDTRSRHVGAKVPLHPGDEEHGLRDTVGGNLGMHGPTSPGCA